MPINCRRVVLPTAKSLVTTFTQDPNGRPIFPVDVNIETEMPASLRVLTKTFLEDLWCEHIFTVFITLVLNYFQIIIGRQVLRCQHFLGMMSQLVHLTTLQ